MCESLHASVLAGGYAILRGIQRGLRLPANKMLPSFASLRDFGNTSSASTWYTWSYIESTSGLGAGETVLQVCKSSRGWWRDQHQPVTCHLKNAAAWATPLYAKRDANACNKL